MVRISLNVKNSFAEPLEAWCCETGCPNWGLEKIDDKHVPLLFGYFDDKPAAEAGYAALRAAFPELPESPSMETVCDRDWKEEYKKFLTAWNYKCLNWVPLWMRGDFKEPPNEKVFYFDAGLAFGTGDHPTTRLCAMSMLDYIDACGGDVSDKFLIDAGCGSGILALTAKMFGFGKVYGFDRDEEAVRVSLENAKLNNIALDGISFEHAGIERALEGKKADIVLANIISDVLCIYADNLIDSVKAGGRLILSGILAAENARVKDYFLSRLDGREESCESMSMGDWSRLEIKFKDNV